jgi:uncharacterized repeat protein (TIGR01451 family)
MPTHRARLTRVASILPLFLMVGILGWVVPLVSQASNGGQLADGSSGPLFQVTATPTLTVTTGISVAVTPVAPLTQTSTGFRVSFEELGYGEKILESPWGSTQYSFRLPDNWLVADDSYFELEYSYFFTDLGRMGEDKPELSFFGEVAIYLDNRLLQTYSLDQPRLEEAYLRVDLPPELFNEQPGVSHQISVVLNASLLCSLLHEAKLVIHPESTLFLNYSLSPPTLELADYPRPFYQRSFEPDQVRFVLPNRPSETELRVAAALAAGLGDLTRNSLVISATTDVDWLETAGREQTGSEHLFVIGQPDRNELLGWLNDKASLPVPMRRRQMAMSSRGSTAVMPGGVFSYTMTVTNTTSVSAKSLSLTDRIPYQARLVGCRPACTESGKNEVSWPLVSLSPGEVASFVLTLRLTDTVRLPTEVPSLENSAILADEAGVPLNISSLTTTVGSPPTAGGGVISAGRGGYFFVQNGQPVPEGDGILQEIISPWDPQKVILLVTGVNEEAVYKASQALSLGTTFPEMKGPAALIREVRPSPPVTETLMSDSTLADLGYSDQTVYGVYRHEIVYYFYVPLGWQLTEDAYLRLLFSHSEAISEYGSTLTVFLGNTPMTTVILNRENANGGSVQVRIPGSNVRPGASNRFSIQVSMQVDKEECAAIDMEQAWLNISQDSVLHLDHRVQDSNILGLDYFPFPFDTQSDLGDVLFALPATPGLTEQEALLRLAADLGNAANVTGLGSSVSLGGALDVETLSHYHIIAIGHPSSNLLIQQVNSLLPQPFIPGGDEVEQQVGEVILRLPPDTPLGYIQQIPSPWNEHKALLIVTGTTDEGISWAIDALTRFSWRLGGNLALVREGQAGIEVQSIDTRRLTSGGIASSVATAVPELTPVATITPTPGVEVNQTAVPTPLSLSLSTTNRQEGLPPWVMLFAGSMVIVVLAILTGVIWRFWQRQGG